MALQSRVTDARLLLPLLALTVAAVASQSPEAAPGPSPLTTTIMPTGATSPSPIAMAPSLPAAASPPLLTEEPPTTPPPMSGMPMTPGMSMAPGMMISESPAPSTQASGGFGVLRCNVGIYLLPALLAGVVAFLA